MPKSDDRRVLRTKRNITQAFIQLLETQDFKKITIASIADLADINRRTFYLHYEDIFVLLDELENGLNVVFKNELEVLPDRNFQTFLNQLLDFMQKNKQLMIALLSQPESKFLAKTMTIATEAGYAKSEFNSSVEKQYCWNYVEHGLRGVLLNWLLHNDVPQKRMVEFVDLLITNSLQSGNAA